MSWFDDIKTPKIKAYEEHASRIPEGLWVKCKQCSELLASKQLEENHQVCLECGYHMRLLAWQRIALLSDDFKAWDEHLVSLDPLGFDDVKPYAERLKSAFQKTGLKDAIITGEASLDQQRFALGVFEFEFLGGSMGVVVGEKITRLFERSLEQKIPSVLVSASGGARMQEGILSLMQMAKTSLLIEQLREAGIPYISILTHPTTGGVAASFAMLGDVILAEPEALIGFAGPRVIQQTLRQSLPSGFQRSEFLKEKGFLDRVVSRLNLRKELSQLLKFLVR